MLRDFFKKHGWRYVPGILLLVLCAYIQTLSPLALGRAVELAENRAPWSAFIKEAASVFFIAVMVFVTRFGWRWFVIITSREMEVYIRDRLYTHLVYLPVDFYGRNRSGNLMAYAINDVNAVRMMFGMVVAQVVNSLSSVMFSIGRMSGSIHPMLTLYSLLPVPLAIMAVIIIGKKIRIRAKHAQEMFSVLSGHVNENINGMRVLKAFAQEKAQYQDYEKESLEKLRANESWYFTGALMDPVIKTVFGISYAIGLIYGGHLVMNDVISLADYVAFNSYLTMIVFPVVAIGRISNNLQRGLASYKRLKELFDEEEIPAFDKTDDGKEIGEGIECKNLTFRYKNATRNSLEDISFTVKPGGMLGVVGPTGGGKSTLLSLLVKLVPPSPGQLFIGGRDIYEIPALALRKQTGFVPQDGFLFDESIRDNVRFFSEATQDEIDLALADAGMTGDIDEMPEKQDTLCGERGNHLSGGQRQRVSLARALVRNPKLLILDDTLSAVDAHTESQILKSLKARLSGCTSVVVAHRLSAVRDADEILYIADGRITERGTHEELLKKNGDYARLYALQNREEENEHGK
ncbi:MAG: ABC transporter ATP-binding protein [Clostridia bacterium]|nr:ABC transporter ATP-binding protein [Clostridia bacterium]